VPGKYVAGARKVCRGHHGARGRRVGQACCRAISKLILNGLNVSLYETFLAVVGGKTVTPPPPTPKKILAAPMENGCIL
jgi:hypothetical protein